MRALVTGGLGFIGSRIAEALLAEGHEVVVLDLADPRVHGDVPAPPRGARLVRGDVRDDAALARAFGPAPDVVFHEAAMVGLGRGAVDAGLYSDVNVLGTLRVLSAAAAAPRRPRIVLASSMAVYGEGEYECTPCGVTREGARRAEDLARAMWDPLCPVCGSRLEARPTGESQPQRGATVYAVSKIAQEAMALAVGRETGVPVVALRYHNAYGPRMPRATPYAGVASLFKTRLLAGEPPLVHEDGRQARDFVHVDDVVQANLLASSADAESAAFEAFNVGSGEARPILDLAEGLCRAILPGSRPVLTGAWRAGDARHVYGSIAKARRVLGYAPRVAFADGVR
ncbi:MAG TPA: NAD-dependent epimerase/dehydratase family protein, partial [Candidatus Thermoplasmatota archaeon]|nr:NAD-dependent epimerase/dehydratase family protein [Candidatus Thermoplasmatota archaeon]